MGTNSANGQNNKERPSSKIRLSYLYILGIILLGMLWLLPISSIVKQTTWKEMESVMIPQKAIDKMVVTDNNEVRVYIKKEFANRQPYKEVMRPDRGEILPGPHYVFTIGSIETFERKLDEAEENMAPSEKIEVVYEKKSGGFWPVLGWLAPLMLFLFLWPYLLRITGQVGSGSLFNFGKSGAKLIESERQTKVTFDDVAGLEEAKTEVREVVNFLKSPDAFTSLGAKIPKGVILVGPPGTGKTLLAKAVAGEAQVPFFSMSGSEFVEMFVGVGASRVRDLFGRAKEKAPCIIFIDEIDAIGRSRGKNAFYSGSNDERESTLNQLLTEMDGFESNSGVIVLAATNRADMLDPALLRPGRFDRHIFLELPNMKEREAIFKVHLRPLTLPATFDGGFLVSQTPGFSGADIANVCNEAALIAARRKKAAVEKEDFLEAIDRIIAGLEKKSKIISVQEKQVIAYHEAGHAVVSWMLPHVDPLLKVSIIPRGKSLGAAWYLPEEHELRTRSEFTEQICASLGGRAAEDVIYGEVTSGALDDLEKVTKLAYRMVAFYGFNKEVGVVSFYDSTGQTEQALTKPYSEETGKLIDQEVRKLLQEAYEFTKSLLLKQQSQLKEVAGQLLKKEVLFKEDLEYILGKRLSVVNTSNISVPQ